MNKIKIIVKGDGTCDEFSINGVQLGQGIEKLQVVVEPNKSAQIILDTFYKVEIECENAMFEKENLIKNKTLEGLKQKLINKMFQQNSYQKEDIEILKILFDKKD